MRMRFLFTALALLALVCTWASIRHIAETTRWYRNADMNIHNVVDALSLNSGYTLGIVDQPAAPTKLLLAFDFRVRNALGLLPVWTAKRFARSAEPFHEYARLVQTGREHSRGLVILVIIFSAGFVGHVTRRYEAACLAVILLCGSSGLLFHGLLVRPELLCTAFGGVLALYAAWLGCQAASPASRARWLLLAGLACGLALLSKLPALYYCTLICAWCWLAPLLKSRSDAPAPAVDVSWRWTIASSLVGGAGLLALLVLTQPHPILFDPIGSFRLRLAAGTVAILPLVGFISTQSRLGRYLVQRTMDTTIVLSGILGAFVLWFGLLRLHMPADAAGQYLSKILNTVFYPDPLFVLYTKPEEAHRLREFLRFFWETPALFFVTSALTIALLFCQGIPVRFKALALLLLTQGLGMALLLSKRQFTDQYSVFVQIPFLLIWPVALASLQTWWNARTPVSEHKWPVVLAVGAAFFLVLIHPLELRSKYDGYQEAAVLPVQDLTITFLYDHDAHPPAFLAALKARYPDRQIFATELNRFLSDPSNRY